MISRMLSTIIFFFSLSSQVLAASPEPVEGEHGMVVTAHCLATEVGLKILKEGGNAVDAAVAVGYALAVVYPCCGNLGGGGFMLIRFKDGKSVFLNFREKAPSAIKPELFLDRKGQVINEYLSTGHLTGGLKKPYLAVGIPGTVMGLNLALCKYGTMPLKKVLAPAINLAENGFKLRSSDINTLKLGEPQFKQQPNIGRIFLKDGQMFRPGDCLVQKNLANTLKKIAAKDAAAFYEGSIGDEIVKASQAEGGLISKMDLHNYTVDIGKPVICSYRGYQIMTAPPPGSGTTICEALQILEKYPLAKFGFHAALGSHYVIEAMRFAYYDRNHFLGDPRFVKNPINTLLSSSHIRSILHKIRPNKATSSTAIKFKLPEGSNTTAYVIVDKAGNAVSVTYTLNDYFGARVIPGDTGFFLNNEMADFTIKSTASNNYGLFQGNQNLIAPNKRPLSSIAPTILTKNDQLSMVIATPGGSTIPSQLINVIINVIDYGMNIQEAIDAPRFHMQWLPDKVYIEPYTFSKDTQDLLAKMGYHFHLGSVYNTPLWGSVSGIIVDSSTGKLFGAEDSRKTDGCALGY